MRERPRRKGPSALVSWAVILVSFAVTALGVYRGVHNLAHGVFDPTSIGTGEGGTAVEARKGTYYVFQLVGESGADGSDGGTVGRTPTLRPADVRVTGPDGNSVPTAAANSFETYREGLAVYRAAVKFTTADAGTYVVRVRDTDTDVLVKRAAFDVVGDTLTWFGVAALGGLGLALGLILLITGVVRRSHAESPVPVAPPFTLLPTVTPTGAPAAPPATVGPAPTAPGWYPDPWQQAPWRYHDGVAWTSHTG